jgi:hypothetical protein
MPTLSMDLQSMIARALDDDKYVLVASLDLPSDFNFVDISQSVAKKIEKYWLARRYYPNDLYVAEGENLFFFCERSKLDSIRINNGNSSRFDPRSNIVCNICITSLRR